MKTCTRTLESSNIQNRVAKMATDVQLSEPLVDYWILPHAVISLYPAATQLLLVQSCSICVTLFNFKWNLLEIMGYTDDTWPRKLHGGYPAKNLYLQ